jgi:hypothetical protein
MKFLRHLPPYWQVEGYGVPFKFSQYKAMPVVI